jgi:hypothetical protein
MELRQSPGLGAVAGVGRDGVWAEMGRGVEARDCRDQGVRSWPYLLLDPGQWSVGVSGGAPLTSGPMCRRIHQAKAESARAARDCPTWGQTGVLKGPVKGRLDERRARAFDGVRCRGAVTGWRDGPREVERWSKCRGTAAATAGAVVVVIAPSGEPVGRCLGAEWGNV